MMSHIIQLNSSNVFYYLQRSIDLNYKGLLNIMLISFSPVCFLCKYKVLDLPLGYRVRFLFKDACNIVGDTLSDIYKLQALKTVTRCVKKQPCVRVRLTPTSLFYQSPKLSKLQGKVRKKNPNCEMQSQSWEKK